MGGFKASETLLGIETKPNFCISRHSRLGFKASETLLGIETQPQISMPPAQSQWGFKASETLLGIETCFRNINLAIGCAASKPLKPF